MSELSLKEPAGNEPKRRAFLSAYDRHSVAKAAEALQEDEWELFGTLGTVAEVKAYNPDIGIVDVATQLDPEEVRDIGHTATLNRWLIDAIKRRDQQSGEPFLDLVYINPKPDYGTGSREDLTAGIGAAADAGRLVATTPRDLFDIVDRLVSGAPIDEKYRRMLGQRAWLALSSYAFRKAGVAEDVSQKTVRFDKHPLADFHVLNGELDYEHQRNLDSLIEAMATIAHDMAGNGYAVPSLALAAKNNNICAATMAAPSMKELTEWVIESNPTSAYGSDILLNCELTMEMAETLLTYGNPEHIAKRRLSGIFAPSFTDEALEFLKGQQGNLSIVINPVWDRELLSFSLGSLTPKIIRESGTQSVMGPVSRENLTEKEKADLYRDLARVVLAFSICRSSNYETVLVDVDYRLVGAGVGPDASTSIDAALQYAHKNEHDLKGAAACSKNYLLDMEGPANLAKAGVKTILAPKLRGKDNRFKRIAAALNEQGVNLFSLIK